ncbi:UDP-glucose--hexose-1-phosphate uridylyltransferase [Telmatospirillum siberiense]|uniref:Galactose-1-phosphate uridylyltransferase n=1 Tax=Telmatospirillum siberiense TaxID=382514 RepID=A0A2N3PZU3_9PROT|nr:UDP-glucose--hexose-1-phosphate uridylyltransferase [Telmatospirillum siberiense]PKU25922.1 galactose-1-phosphate uridylyltransferase [Telmatospirillum siberiense]
MTLLLEQTSHRRYNPLIREWVLVSPHRMQRPWQGQMEKPAEAQVSAYEPECYLCPGNRRANGEINPTYAGTFVFDNDFAALRSDAVTTERDIEGLLRARGEPGICRVICFSPRHDLTIARMSMSEIGRVIGVWGEQSDELGRLEAINSVQIFENRGAMMGASNPHPHCQIWAGNSIPNETAKEGAAQADYQADHGGCLLCRYLALEEKLNERIVYRNEHFTVLVPYWAVWPFETLVLPRRHVGALNELGGDETMGLADAMSRLAVRYDNLFETPLPYSMGFHQKPTDGQPHHAWHLHAHYYPPLLRSATVRKFMVGFEMLGSPQRDITPESAAQRLREMSSVHYLDR